LVESVSATTFVTLEETVGGRLGLVGALGAAVTKLIPDENIRIKTKEKARVDFTENGISSRKTIVFSGRESSFLL
jgi:hypothetical protein